MVGALSIYSIVLFLTKRSIAANLAHLRQDYDDDMYKSHAFRMESNQSDTISTSVDPRPLNLTHSLGELNVPPPKRLVVSLTTTRKRINQPEMKNVLRRLVEEQDRQPDKVILAVPPDVTELPAWLKAYQNTSKVEVIGMKRDYGPASKVLAAMREGGETAASTVVVFCDDDIVYSQNITAMHWNAQVSVQLPSAFGSRRINVGGEDILEATGTISIRASFLPSAAFNIADEPDVCRLSDDYWISHFLHQNGVALALLPGCQYHFGSSFLDVLGASNGGKDAGAIGMSGKTHQSRKDESDESSSVAQRGWPSTCGRFEPIAAIGGLDALSSRDGDWRAQLRRYEKCQQHLARRMSARLALAPQG